VSCPSLRRPALLLLVLLAGLGSALAIRPGDTPAASGPVFSAGNGVIVFDFVAVGSSTTKTDIITNTGTAPLTIGEVARSGLHAKDFVVSGDTCSGKTLAPSATCALEITFTPSAAGTRAGSLRITDNTDCDNFITLAGSGTSTPAPVTARAATCAPVETQTTTVTTTTTTPGAAPVTAADVISAPKACVSRRTVKLHLTAPKGKTFSKVTVSVRGKRFKTYKGKQIKATLSLAGLPRGRFTMKIRATVAGSKSYALTRHYVTCVKGYSAS